MNIGEGSEAEVAFQCDCQMNNQLEFAKLLGGNAIEHVCTFCGLCPRQQFFHCFVGLLTWS